MKRPGLTEAMRMKCFLVVTLQGMCVREAPDKRRARSDGLREFGMRNFCSVQLASDDDLLGVKQQGGWLPYAVRPRIDAMESAGNTALNNIRAASGLEWKEVP